MASVRKLPNGTFQATISLGRDSNNKQIRKYITRDTEKECKSAARKIEQDYEDGKINSFSNYKFSKWAEKFLEIKKPPELSPTTYRFYKEVVNYHFIPFFQKFKLCQITDIHIREYIAKKRAEKSKKTGKPLSETTIKKHFVILSSMLGMALKHNNPCLEIEAPSGESDPRYVPTPEEFERLLMAIQGSLDEIPVLLAGQCGLREGEIFGLEVNDILPNGKIRIDENRALAEVETDDANYNGPKYQYIDKDPKSINGIRVIAAPEYLLDAINKRIQELGLKDDDKIIDMRPDSYCKRFVKIIKYHNMMLLNKPTGKKASFANETLPKTLHIQSSPIPDFTFHALRHYHATFLFEESFPDKYAAERLGHDVMILKRIYQRLRIKKKDELDDVLKEKLKKP